MPRAVHETRLAYRPPLAWDALTRFLADRAIPGVEDVRGAVYRRTVQTGAGAAIVEAEPAGDAEIALRVSPGQAAGVLSEAARRAFDLDADPEPVRERLDPDPTLGPAVRALPGLRVPGTFDPFELAVRAVLGQQVSVAAARTLARRLVERFGAPLPARDGELTRLFPGPDALAEAPVEAVGLPRARAETIRALARAVGGGLDLAPGAPAARAGLLAIRGIGPWTADYVALRVLRDADAFPAGDLGLRHALAADGRPASAREAARRAEAWRPWRAYAVFYLWETLSLRERA